MANLPRLLPIVFVAVGGVLALKAITSLDLVPGAMHAAQAFAADTKEAKARKPEAATAKAARPSGESDKAADPTEALPITAEQAADAAASASDAAAQAPMAPVCATSIDQLARDAGMSANEVQILQSLGQRRAQLDAREQQLNSRAQLIDAADSKLDGRIKQLQDLNAQIQALIDGANKAADDDVNRLVAVYSAMKPKDAAAALTIMDDDVRLPIAAKMKDRSLAAILGAMNPTAAKELTERLAKRMSAAGGLQEKLDKATASGQSSAAPASAQAAAAPAKAGTKGK